MVNGLHLGGADCRFTVARYRMASALEAAILPVNSCYNLQLQKTFTSNAINLKNCDLISYWVSLRYVDKSIFETKFLALVSKHHWYQ